MMLVSLSAEVQELKWKLTIQGIPTEKKSGEKKLNFRILSRAFWLAYRDPCMHTNVHIWIFIEGNLSKLLLF